MIERHVLDKDLVEDRAEQEDAAAFEGALLQGDRYLYPARHPDAALLPDAADHRAAVEAAHSVDPCLHRAVREIGEVRQDLDQRFAAAAAAALHQPEMAETEKVDQPPCYGPG